MKFKEVNEGLLSATLIYGIAGLIAFFMGYYSDDIYNNIHLLTDKKLRNKFKLMKDDPKVKEFYKNKDVIGFRNYAKSKYGIGTTERLIIQSKLGK
jgi:hypothetical protein